MEIGMYVAQNPDVQQHAANTAAASGFAPGTPEYIQVFQKTAVDHAINFGTAEGRVGAQAVATTSPTENNAQAGTSTGGSQTMNFTAPPPPVPVDLAPVTSAISGVAGSIGTPETGQADTLMGQTQGLATGQQGIREVVDPLAGQVTDIGTSIGTAGTGQADTLMEQTQALATGQTGLGTQITDVGTQIGTDATDTAEATGLYKGQEGIMSGQQGLADTQANILEGQTGLAGTQAGLMSRIGDTATDTREATGLIGAVGTAGTPGTATQAATLPTGLYAGQQTLGTNISDVGGNVTQVGQDVSGIASALANFENISSQERANLLSTLNTRAQELENLENMYGFQTNRLVEAQLGNTGSTGLQPGMMQPPATDPGSLNSILAAERAAQATGQNISSNLTSAANQGLVSNALGPVGTQ